MSFLRYDQDNLIGAGARVLLAPFTEDLPGELTDVYDQKSPYDPQGTWFDVGATSAAPTITRAITVAGFNIQQSQTVILEEPTEVTRSLAIPFAEFSPEMLEILEEGVSSTTAARDKVTFGSIPSLTNYRIALAVRRTQQQGVVQEGSTLASARLRGRDLLWVGYNATLTGDSVAISIGKGDLANGTLTFKLSPDPAVTTEATEQGFWVSEKAKTIA